MGIKAIELGCRDSTFTGGNLTPRYEIIDSEIDLSVTHPTGPENPGEAIFVGNCDGFGKRVDLKISNTLVVIDDRSPGSGDFMPPIANSTDVPNSEPVSSGSVFFVQNLGHGNDTTLTFLPGSTCNRVENTRMEDISSDHMGSSRDLLYLS